MKFIEVFDKYPCDKCIIHFSQFGINFVYYGGDLDEVPTFEIPCYHPDALVRVQKKGEFYHVYLRKEG